MQILSLKTYVYLSILRCFPTYFYTCMCVYTHMYVCVDRFSPTQPPFCAQRCSEFCEERKNKSYQALAAICYLSAAVFAHAETTSINEKQMQLDFHECSCTTACGGSNPAQQ